MRTTQYKTAIDPDSITVPFYQSSGWERVISKSFINSARFIVTGDGIIHTLVIIYPLAKGLGTYIYIPRGPIMSESVSKGDVEHWALEIRKLAQKHHAHWCLIEPDTMEQNQLSYLREVTQGFPKQKLPHQTQKIDLLLSREEILANMSAKTRYNINLADRKKVEIIRIERKEPNFVSSFESFYQMLLETSERAGFKIHDQQHYLDILLTQAPGFRPYLLLAYHEDEVLAGAMFIDTPDETVYLHGGSVNKRRNYMAPYLIQWTAIYHAKILRLKTYDFWGTSDTKVSWQGITKFKRKFGGFTVNYPETRGMIFNPVAGYPYKILSVLKQR